MLRAFLARFALPMILLAAGATLVSMPVIDRLVTAWVRDDAQQRAASIMRTLDAPLGQLLTAGSAREIPHYLARVAADEHLVAVVLCAGREVQSAEPVLPRGVACPNAEVTSSIPTSRIVTTDRGSLQVSEFPVASQPGLGAAVLLVHDASFVDPRQSTARDYLLAFVAVGAVVLSLILISAAWWTFRRWFTREKVKSPTLSRTHRETRMGHPGTA